MTTHYSRHLLGTYIFTLSLIFSGFAQTVCPNSDFSQGNFNGWTGFTGVFGYPAQIQGITAGRHEIITAPGIDPYTCGGLNMLPPAASTSVRLGNSITGAQAERLVYQTNVTAENSLFVYKYAVVLEDPGHTPEAQPEFSVRILNQNGMQVPGPCGVYTVYGGQPGQDFQYCEGVTWLPWTSVGIDLSPYTGQTINIEFTTRDCAQLGHFGYAYISCDCLPLLLDVEYCEGASAITMTAPPGFQSYFWQQTNETTQSITVPDLTAGASYTCMLTTFSNQGNCSLTLGAQVVPSSIVSGYTAAPACVNAPVQFTDISVIAAGSGTISSWEWNFGDGQGSTAQDPVHAYASPGAYNVRLISFSSIGCSDTVEQALTVYAPPNVAFGFQNACINAPVSFDNQSSDAFPMTFHWNFGDSTATSELEDPVHIFTSEGQYTVMLTAENDQGCSAMAQHVITIYPLPMITAGTDVQVCSNTPVTLSGSGGSTYTWNNNVSNDIAFIPAASATYTVDGTDTNGCQNADTVLLTVYAPPVVSAGPDQEVCNGTAVIFAGSGAASYSWSDGIINGQAFTPAVGTFTYTVTGTDANGCQDTDEASLVVHADPVVGAGPDKAICPGASTLLTGSGAVAYVWDNGVTNNVPFSPDATAMYTVTGTDQNGCQGADQVIVAIEAPAAVAFSAPVTSGCDPVEVNFSNQSAGTAGISCHWEFGDGTDDFGCGNVQHLYTTSGCFDVKLTVATALGCVWSQLVPDYICVYPNPVATFTPLPNFITEIDPISEMSNLSTGAVSYNWQFGDGVTSNEEDPAHLFPTDQIRNFTVYLTAISDHGCIDTAAHTIIIRPVLIYYVPNAFTPDSDQFNQVFKPVFTSGYDPYNFNMVIFDRWGEVIFETNNAAIGWDGTYHGEIVQEGVYTWKIGFKTALNDERKEVLGSVTLLR